MLNYDTTHKKFIGSVSNKKGLNIGKTFFLGVLVLPITIFSGCNQTVDCDIEEQHAHFYKRDDSLGMYVLGEKEYSDITGEFKRTDEVIFISEEEAELIKAESNNTLFRIEKNIDQINEKISNHKDYKEYRYKYTWQQPILNSYDIGGQTYYDTTYVEQTSYAWTLDPNHEGLTGEERIITHVYHGYKIVRNENGKLVIEESQNYDSIEELQKNGFTHIKKDFFKKVLSSNKDQEPDYESKPAPQESELAKEVTKSR